MGNDEKKDNPQESKQNKMKSIDDFLDKAIHPDIANKAGKIEDIVKAIRSKKMIEFAREEMGNADDFKLLEHMQEKNYVLDSAQAKELVDDTLKYVMEYAFPELNKKFTDALDVYKDKIGKTAEEIEDAGRQIDLLKTYVAERMRFNVDRVMQEAQTEGMSQRSWERHVRNLSSGYQTIKQVSYLNAFTDDEAEEALKKKAGDDYAKWDKLKANGLTKSALVQYHQAQKTGATKDFEDTFKPYMTKYQHLFEKKKPKYDKEKDDA